MDIQIVQYPMKQNYLSHPYLLKLVTIHGMYILVLDNT